jgi:uncharacterized protein YutE (UPF0331/DUF86 family)
MVISNLNIKQIEDRLGFINYALVKLKKLSTHTEDKFLENDNPAIAESYLRRSLEALFDIGRHITAKMAGKGIVEYKEIAKFLGEKGVISNNLASTIVLMAGYRNRLVHYYHEISDKELYIIITAHLSDIEAFAAQIRQFIEALKKRDNQLLS